MHRSYQSVLPTHNKLLQQRWDTTYYNEHRRKVADVRSVVDTRPPSTYIHMHMKLKKLQLEEERLATIERDNRILLEKMSYIMRTRGRVDNKNSYEYKSLNREKRIRELLRVTKENQEILKRITMRKPEYDHVKWQEDWEENQRFMDSIAAYPRDWWKDTDEDDGDGKKSPGQKSSRSGAESRASKDSAASSRKAKGNNSGGNKQKKEKKEEKEKKKSKEEEKKKKPKEETQKSKEEEEQQSKEEEQVTQQEEEQQQEQEEQQPE